MRSNDTAFRDELSVFFDEFSIKSGRLLLCGDFNYWVDEPASKPGTHAFLNILVDYGPKNYVTSPTHICGHTLDLAIALDDSEAESYLFDFRTRFWDDPDADVLHKLDHALVTFRVSFPRPEKVEKTFHFRKYANLQVEGFDEFIGEVIHHPTVGRLAVDKLAVSYRSSINSYLDVH